MPRLATRFSLWLILLYLPLLAAVALWARFSVQEATHSLMAETAQLVATELVSTLPDELLTRLASGSDEAEEAGLDWAEGVVAQSEMIESLSLIDAQGSVLFSTSASLVEISIEPPASLLESTLVPQFSTGTTAETRAGRFRVFVPLLQGPGARGYLRLEMRSTAVEGLYSRSSRRLALLALVGLVLIATLAFLLHLQVSRNARQITRAIEDALAGERSETAPVSSEFTSALEAAGRLGRELSDSRAKNDKSMRNLADIGRLLDVGIILLDPQGELEYIGGRCRELLLISGERSDEEGWEALRPQFQQAIDTACRRPSSVATAHVRVGEEDEPTTLSCQVRQLVEDECTGFLILVRDLDLVEAMETDLLDAARLRGLTSIYMAMAHDLRAPLNAISLHLEVLRGGGEATAVDPEKRIDTMRAELERLDRSLTLLTGHAAPLREEEGRFELETLIRDLIDLVQAQAKQQRVAIHLSSPAEPMLAAGNRDYLKQAILTVVLNAFEAMPEEGNLHFRLSTGDSKHRIDIENDGPGIADQVADRIFDLHYTNKENGSGIGLYVARSIVSSQQGTLELTHYEAGRTSFRFTLPDAAES